MTEIDKLKEFENNINYVFKDKKLLKLALTHKSYAYEVGHLEEKEYNERIEFLGDAILEHIISKMLYNNKNKYKEGEMTRKRAAIVCEYSLCQAMRRVKADKYIYLGKCERTHNSLAKDAIIADLFEAVLGAIYLDSGFEAAEKYCLDMLKIEIETVLSGENINMDYKTILQEKLQVNGTVKIDYITINEYGPEHDKTFEVEVRLNDKKIGEGIGKNKKQAEQNSAKYALQKIK